MTESNPPHPTDEALSAAIDGYDEAAAAHAAFCERCRYRTEAMRGVASMLAVPPPGHELGRERAIAQAVRVWPEAAGGRQRWPMVLGAAAAVLLVLLLVPVVLGGSDSKDDMASSPVARDAQEEASTKANSTGGDNLGSFDDAAALRNALAPLLGEDDTASFGAVAAGGSTDAAEDRSASSTTTMAPSPTTAFAAPPAALTAESGVCTGDARRDYGSRVGALLYSAGLTWSGQRSVVLVYAIKDPLGSLDKLALVLRQSDCQLLTSVSL